MNIERYKHAINKSKMRSGPKIEHHHMKAMLYKILWTYSQSQNKLTLLLAETKFE